MTQWSIDLCRRWRKIGEVGEYDFAGTERWLSPGEWALSCGAGSPDWSSGRGPTDVDTIRVVAGRNVAFAGFVAPVRNGQGGLVRTQAEAESLEWTGPDLWNVFEIRQAWPEPASLPPWRNASHDIRTGPASSALAGFIRANLGDLALAQRQVEGLTVSDGNVGTSGEWTARMQPLADLVTRICLDGGITCRPTIDFGGNIDIAIGAQRNLTNTVRITDREDMALLEARRVARPATFAIAGGQGELTDRAFAYADDGSAGIDRRETFVNRSNLTSTDELAAAAATATLQPEWSVRFDPAGELDIDTVNDVHVGDLVGAHVDDDLVAVPVTAMVFTLNAQRKEARPVLGGASWNELTGLLSAVNELSTAAAGDVT